MLQRRRNTVDQPDIIVPSLAQVGGIEPKFWDSGELIDVDADEYDRRVDHQHRPVHEQNTPEEPDGNLQTLS